MPCTAAPTSMLASICLRLPCLCLSLPCASVSPCLLQTFKELLEPEPSQYMTYAFLFHHTVEFSKNYADIIDQGIAFVSWMLDRCPAVQHVRGRTTSFLLCWLTFDAVSVLVERYVPMRVFGVPCLCFAAFVFESFELLSAQRCALACVRGFGCARVRVCVHECLNVAVHCK